MAPTTYMTIIYIQDKIITDFNVAIPMRQGNKVLKEKTHYMV